MKYTTKHYRHISCWLLPLLLTSGLSVQTSASGPGQNQTQTVTPSTADSLSSTLPLEQVVAPAAGVENVITPAFKLSTFRAVYKADYKGLPIRATGIRELTQTADNMYLLSSSANSFLASIMEQSRFAIGKDHHVIPTEYQYHRGGIGKSRDAILRFDWPSQQVQNDVQDQPWMMSIPDGTLDKLSYQLQMRLDLTAAHQQGLPWPDLSYQVADGGHMKSYHFSVVGIESVNTPVGKFNALRVTRDREDSDRITDFWLAPEYDFMLIRFVQKEEDRGGFELMLKEATFLGEPIKGL